MFILASSSPRRKELIKKLISEYTIVVPEVDERFFHLPPEDIAREVSKLKAYAVSSQYPNDEVLACDTVVILHGRALGKPADEEEAIKMLKEESGSKQIVLSAYTYIGKGKEITRTVATEVRFANLSDELIEDYVKTKLPLDKAGAYGIQDGYPLIEKIIGSYDNVMGLPTEDIKTHVFGQK